MNLETLASMLVPHGYHCLCGLHVDTRIWPRNRDALANEALAIGLVQLAGGHVVGRSMIKTESGDVLILPAVLHVHFPDFNP